MTQTRFFIIFTVYFTLHWFPFGIQFRTLKFINEIQATWYVNFCDKNLAWLAVSPIIWWSLKMYVLYNEIYRTNLEAHLIPHYISIGKVRTCYVFASTCETKASYFPQHIILHFILRCPFKLLIYTNDKT